MSKILKFTKKFGKNYKNNNVNNSWVKILVND